MHAQVLKQNVISLTLVAGWGMGIFTVSSVGCGFANSFWTLLAWRIVMGAGEASIINLTGAMHPCKPGMQAFETWRGGQPLGRRIPFHFCIRGLHSISMMVSRSLTDWLSMRQHKQML